jgi:hypothetical protein
MKVIIGAIVAFLVGAGCRYFDIPVRITAASNVGRVRVP